MRFFRNIGTSRGWKTFAFEVAVIAVGVGLALTAEDLLTTYNKKKAAELAFENTASDLFWLHVSASERLSTAECSTKRRNAIRDALMKNEGEWTPIPLEVATTPEDESLSYMLLPIPLSNWPTETWKSAVASGAAANMGPERFSQLNRIFGLGDLIRKHQGNEIRLLGTLSHLRHAGPMSSFERRVAASKLGELTASNTLIKSLAEPLQKLTLELIHKYSLSNYDEVTQGTLASSIRKQIQESTIKRLYPSCYKDDQLDDLLLLLDEVIVENNDYS